MFERHANDVGTPKNGGEKEAGLGWEALRHSAVSRISKQKNFLFLLKEKRVREKIKKCRENFSVLLSRLVGWAETLGGVLPFTAEIVAQKRFELRPVIAATFFLDSNLTRR